MHVERLEQVPPHRLTRAALEQNVVRHDDGAGAVHPEQRLHVLEEVELLVLGGGPEVLTLVGVGLRLQFALLVHDPDAALLPERRVAEHHRKAVVGIVRQAVHSRPDRRLVRGDPVQVEVHDAEPDGCGHDLPAVYEARPKVGLPVRVERGGSRLSLVRGGERAPVLTDHMVVRGQQESARSARGIANGVVRS